MYEAWDNIEEAYYAERRNHKKTVSEMLGYKANVEKIQNATFFQRLKWLFGYK